MTTSSDQQHPTPASKQPWQSGDHWDELTATLSPESTEAFGDWLDGELEAMVDRLDEFTSRDSLKKSLRR